MTLEIATLKEELRRNESRKYGNKYYDGRDNYDGGENYYDQRDTCHDGKGRISNQGISNNRVDSEPAKC